jgi:hypothetical protein
MFVINLIYSVDNPLINPYFDCTLHTFLEPTLNFITCLWFNNECTFIYPNYYYLSLTELDGELFSNNTELNVTQFLTIHGSTFQTKIPLDDHPYNRLISYILIHWTLAKYFNVTPVQCIQLHLSEAPSFYMHFRLSY